MKSLVQSIFADDDDVAMAEEEQEKAEKTVNKKTKRISFAACLDTSKNEKTKLNLNQTSIYIEETSSEENDD